MLRIVLYMLGIALYMLANIRGQSGMHCYVREHCAQRALKAH